MTLRRALGLGGTMAVWALAAGGCGGGTKTVSVSNLPEVPTTTSSSTSGTETETETTATDTASTTSSATRTAGAPAFTQQTATAGGTAAVATVKAHGYTPNDTSQYRPDQTLRVLVGTHTGSGDGYGQQAFFFVDGRYIGTDSTEPSATLRVVSQSDTQVTLAYPLYRSRDALCCPSGGEAKVGFQLDNGRLTPMQAIPPAKSSTGFSRQ